MKLTQAFLLNAKPGAKPYKLRDDKATNLYLHVSTAGGKRWKFDYRLGGTDGTYTLGSFPQVTLIADRCSQASQRSGRISGEGDSSQGTGQAGADRQHRAF
jgi:hypothetical protein